MNINRLKKRTFFSTCTYVSKPKRCDFYWRINETG